MPDNTFRQHKNARAAKRVQALRRLLSIGTLVPLVTFSTGAAAFNQTSSSDTTADAIVQAALDLSSENLDTLTQSATGPGNQSADHGATADLNADAGVDMDAVNTTGITQVGPAGSGAGNQGATLGAAALTFLALGIDSAATNNSLLSQLMAGPGSSNQDAMVDLAAGSDILTDLSGIAMNLMNITQVMGGSGNQDASADADSTTVGQQQVGGNAGNVSVLMQMAGGAGASNQSAGNTAVAQNFFTTIQNLITQNNLGIVQVCGSGCNQDADAALTAVTVGTQFVGGNATNTNVLTQNNGGGSGSSNQTADNLASAILGMFGTQNQTTGNNVSIVQVAGNGQGNQSAPVTAVAVGVADQTMVGGATNTNILAQNASGDGSGNQDASNDSDATGIIAGTQAVDALNNVGVTQVGGSGQSNQNAPVTVVADADASQTLGAVLGNFNLLSQNGSGDGSHNQALENAASAVGVIGASQDLDAGNNVGVTQVGGTGQGNQNAPITAVVDADAEQNIGLAAGNENILTQNASGDGSANQWAENAAAAVGVIGASQDLDATNNIGVAQVNGTGQASQNADIDAVIDADAAQNIGLLTGNENMITQLAGGADGSVNQNADNTSDAAGVIGADQDVDAANNVNVTQQSNASAGAAAQSVVVTPTADVDATQNLGAFVGNTNSIFQDPTNANQSATNDTSAAGVIGASQDASAVNNVNAAQNLNVAPGAGAQFLGITPTATTTAEQNVGLLAGNDNDIAQMGEDGSVNQNADNTSDATGVIGATQTAGATNTINVQQLGTANQGAIAQAGNIAPTATTTAGQTVGGATGNSNTLGQTAMGDGAYNQDATNDATADLSVGADQDATSSNTINALQFCNVSNGACAQYFETAPTATTDADQTVDAGAANDNSITQDGGSGDQGNQAADNTSTADVAVDADQDASSSNDVGIMQICTVSGGACAQYWAGGNVTSSTTANQDISAGAENENDIVQTGGDGQGNQDATNDTTATTDVAADQAVDSSNDVNVMQQASGANAGNQAATTDVSADADADQTIDATSGNDNSITQTGGDGQSNQAADNTADASTTVDANQDIGSTNTVNLGQTSTSGGNQTAGTSANATTTSTLNITGGSNNNTTITQQ